MSLAIFGYNLMKKNRTAANYAVSAVGLASAGLFILTAIALILPLHIPAAAHRKAELSLMLAIAALFVCFIILYPYLKPRAVIFAAASFLPAAGMCAVVMFTDIILLESGGDLVYGAGYSVYCAFLILYFLATLAITGFKLMQHENRALRNDLMYICGGLAFFFGMFLFLSIYLPSTGKTVDAAAFGTLVSYSSILIIMNYATINVKTVDLKKFYATAFSWMILFALLFIPTFLAIEYNSTEYLVEPIPPIGVALLLFAYLFLIFKYLRPRLESISQRGYRSLAARVDELFSQQAGGARDDAASEDHLRALVDGIAEKFNITSAHLYLSVNNDSRFSVTHATGSRIMDTQITLAGPLAEIIGRNPEVLYKPSIYSEEAFRPYREGVREYLERNHIEVILPFLNPEGQIIGFLTLGQLRNNRVYSKSLLEAFELYRIQFQQQLSNALLLERVRSSQVLEHDQMVVNSVKKRIMPHAMGQITSYRISSFYINNSPYGGDYFDSVPIGDDALALFMADSSYAGIDSALILLELYTVLHTPSKAADSPEKILGAMNWTVATSRFSSKYASAYCAILDPTGILSYANAAFTPLIIFNPGDNSFTACDTVGVPVGVDRNSKYESKSVRLAPGSTAILCSDGLISSINPEGNTYGLDRLRNVLRTGRDKAPADIARLLYDDLTGFIRDKKQINDISAILFRFK